MLSEKSGKKVIGERILGLDILRSLAISIVLIFHGNQIILKDHASELLENLRLPDGVDVFFVLSGFLIGSIILDMLNHSKLSMNKVFIFLKRRWFRTLPNYYLFLGINIFLVMYHITDGHLNQWWHYLFFCQNFWKPDIHFFWESWSLAVEEWFYFIIIWLIFLLTQWINSKKAFLMSALFLIIASLMYRISLYTHELDYFWWENIFRKTVLCRLDAIGFGVLFAWLRFYYYKIWFKYRFHFAFIGFLLIIGVLYSDVIPHHFFYQTFYFSLSSISLAFLLPLFSSVQSIFPAFLEDIFIYISKISYSLYLTNMVVYVLITKYMILSVYIQYLLFWVLNIIAASIVYYAFEIKMTALRDKIKN